MHEPKLIVTDDDPTVISFIKEVAEEIGYKVFSAGNGKLLLNTINETDPSVIILDMVMPDMDGIETLKELAARKCTAAIILVTGYQKDYLETANILGTAQGLNIIGSLCKPFSLDKLNELLQTAYSS